MRAVPLLVFAGTAALAGAQTDLRPPAVPLVATDPYFSVWSRADRLTDTDTTHWTGKPQRLYSTVTVDGATYRLMGTNPAIPAMAQQGMAEVTPTRSIYRFAGAGVAVTLTFMTPALPEDVDLLSRPVTYLVWDVKATNGQPHKVALRYGNTGELAVDTPDQTVKWEYVRIGALGGYKIGSTTQPVLAKAGDDRRIDWGYLYAMGPKGWTTENAPVGPAPTPGGALLKPTAPGGDPQVGWLVRDLGKVTSAPSSAHVILAYDDLYGIQYFSSNLRAFWRRGRPNGGMMDGPKLVLDSEARYGELKGRCEAFDAKLGADLVRTGGERYAKLCALAFRQSWAGSKIVADAKGQPLFFPKENNSNGCIGTVDIIFPQSPLLLLFGPTLTKALLVSNLDYASSGYWKWPFAPHDLGQYPKANGQVYGGGERTEDGQMPVEESGNMLILTLALAQMEGNAKFAEKYWPTLTRWAVYLKNEGFDPGNQLSTDDFMGPLAHQTNLSIKATLGLGAYARLARMLGKPEAASYEATAKAFADRFAREARDGDHLRLAFDQAGSWGQKYNLVWDKILDLGLYPDSIRQEEMAYYRKVAKPFGLPLDSRKDGTQTKLDWTLWTATLTGEKADFDAILDGPWRYVNETKQRTPMADWYNAETGNMIGFTARPVVGALFLKMLYDKPLWASYAGADVTKGADWARLPKRPTVVQVVPTAEGEAATWRYTTEKPDENWSAASFEDSAWRTGKGGFGGNIPMSTFWGSADIWTRREFEFSGPTDGLFLRIFHDEDAEVYLNGSLIAKRTGYVTTYDDIPLDAKAKALFRQGKNVLAIHCHQTSGGQGLDAGFVRIVRK